MPENNNDTVGVDIGWSKSGFKVGIKSRLLASLDWFTAAKIEKSGVSEQRLLADEKAREKSRDTLIEAATASVAKQFDRDPDAALAFLNRALPDLIQKQMNYEAVIDTAIAHVENLPSPDLQGVEEEPEQREQPDRLSADFMARFRDFAERANEDVVRERWAQVLAAEAMKPGTFSPKVLRAIDEIDPGLAVLFSEFASLRIGDAVPMCICSISDVDILRFVEEGLVDSAGLGFLMPAGLVTLFQSEHHVVGHGGYAVAVLSSSSKGHIGQKSPLIMGAGGSVSTEVHKLTHLGMSLASLSNYDPLKPLRLFAEKLAASSPDKFAWIGSPVASGIQFAERVEARGI